MVHVRYCPVCGAEVDPILEITNPGRAQSEVTCPECGAIEVEVELQSPGEDATQ